MISPTGKGIRDRDKWGSGAYESPRGHSRTHNGTDFICTPGQSIFSPISGLIIREARPYADSVYSGILIRNDNISIMMFYLIPDKTLIQTWAVKGKPIGIAQDISLKYPDMTPHIHLSVKRMNPALLLDLP